MEAVGAVCNEDEEEEPTHKRKKVRPYEGHASSYHKMGRRIERSF
jgi:hypothetical protein